MKFIEGWYLPDGEKHFSNYLMEVRIRNFQGNIKNNKEKIQLNLLIALIQLLILELALVFGQKTYVEFSKELYALNLIKTVQIV